MRETLSENEEDALKTQSYAHKRTHPLGGCCSVLLFLPMILVMLVLLNYFLGQILPHLSSFKSIFSE
jgi:hypothetical protein